MSIRNKGIKATFARLLLQLVPPRFSALYHSLLKTAYASAEIKLLPPFDTLVMYKGARLSPEQEAQILHARKPTDLPQENLIAAWFAGDNHNLQAIKGHEPTIVYQDTE